MSTMSRALRNRWIPVALLAALLTVPALAGSERFVARIGEPFEIDRHVYPAGTVTIKTVGDYTPGSTLNEVWVGRDCLGVMLARQENAPGPIAQQDAVEFRRHASGHLVLVGFSRAGEASSRLYHLERTSEGGRWAPAEGHDGADLLAARLD